MFSAWRNRRRKQGDVERAIHAALCAERYVVKCVLLSGRTISRIVGPVGIPYAGHGKPWPWRPARDVARDEAETAMRQGLWLNDRLVRVRYATIRKLGK